MAHPHASRPDMKTNLKNERFHNCVHQSYLINAHSHPPSHGSFDIKAKTKALSLIFAVFQTMFFFSIGWLCFNLPRGGVAKKHMYAGFPD